jgi:cobalt-zinc-cadmium efflux system membrane fusion protein
MRSLLSVLIAVILSSLVCAAHASAQDHDHHDKDPFSNGEPHGGAGDGIKLTDQGKTAIGIEVRSAERRALPGRIVTSGKLESIPTQEYVQHAPIAGRVEQVLVQPGQYVQPGQTLLLLSSPELQQLGAQLLQEKTQIEAEVTAKKAELDGDVSQAQTQRDLSETTYKRELQLFEERIGSQKSMQQAKAELELALNRLTVAKQKRQAALNALRTRLSINVDSLKQRLRQLGVSDVNIAKMLSNRNGITSVPVRTVRGGLVTELTASAGQSIEPADPLVKVSNLTTLWATANIYESDMSKVRLGQPIVVRIGAFPKQQFTGRITFISSEVDPTTRTLPVKVEVVNQGSKIKPGMFAELSLQTSEPVYSITLPRDAVIADKGHYLAYIQEGNEYKPTFVEIGNSLGDEIEIRSGITAGQKVVVRGAFQLDAQRLKSVGDTALFTHPTEEAHEEHEHEEGKSTNNQLLSPQLLILVSIAFVLGVVITAIIQKRQPFMVVPPKAKLEPKVPDTEKTS